MRFGFIRVIGQTALSFVKEVGRFGGFCYRFFANGLTPPFYGRLILVQMMRIGYASLPVVALTSFFTGGVLVLQIYYGGDTINAEAIIATIVALGITRELAPVLSGLMVAGRISASIAAEIGTMRVTDQIDALVTLSTNPYKYLVTPRVIAALFTLPLLVLVADIIGILGGFAVSTESLGFNAAAYIQNTWEFLEMEDIISGMIKASVFGFLIVITGCFHGFNSAGGAQGVGRATIKAVVSSSVLIFASNYVMTSVFFTN